jgi:hypothetical protein
MAIIGTLLYYNKTFSAVKTLLCFLTYCRPGEIDTLKIGQLISPNKQNLETQLWGLILGPYSSDNPTKSNEREESVLFDTPGYGWVASLLLALTRDRAPDLDVFPVTAADTARDWQMAVETLQLHSLDLNRYSLRHAGASHDLLHKVRDLGAVKARGRWKTDSSMRRYTKAAKAMDLANRFPPAVLEYGNTVDSLLEEIFSGRSPAPKPP